MCVCAQDEQRASLAFGINWYTERLFDTYQGLDAAFLEFEEDWDSTFLDEVSSNRTPRDNGFRTERMDVFPVAPRFSGSFDVSESFLEDLYDSSNPSRDRTVNRGNDSTCEPAPSVRQVAQRRGCLKVKTASSGNVFRKSSACPPSVGGDRPKASVAWLPVVHAAIITREKPAAFSINYEQTEPLIYPEEFLEEGSGSASASAARNTSG